MPSTLSMAQPAVDCLGAALRQRKRRDAALSSAGARACGACRRNECDVVSTAPGSAALCAGCHGAGPRRRPVSSPTSRPGLRWPARLERRDRAAASRSPTSPAAIMPNAVTQTQVPAVVGAKSFNLAIHIVRPDQARDPRNRSRSRCALLVEWRNAQVQCASIMTTLTGDASRC